MSKTQTGPRPADQKVAGVPEQTGPQWPSEDSAQRAIGTTARHYLDHMTQGRVHSDRAINRAQEIERRLHQIAALQGEVDQLERERSEEAQGARIHHEQAGAFAVMLQSVGAPLPQVEMPPAPAATEQGDPRQHSDQFGGPQTGSFSAVPGEGACPCGSLMVLDQRLGWIHPHEDGKSYDVAGDACRRPKPGQTQVLPTPEGVAS